MMKKRIFVILICFAFLLSACSPRLVGEKKAKEAGLALINHAFDVNETDAVVEYAEHVGESYVRGDVVQFGTEEPRRLYKISVGEDEDGNHLYYAEVNAVTGVAYRADKSKSLIPRTAEQLTQAAAIGEGDDLPVEDFDVDEAGALQLAEEWVRAHFEPDIPVLRTVPNSTMTDNVDFPLFFVNGFVIFIDGTIYSVEVCWPSMEVTSVYLYDQES